MRLAKEVCFDCSEQRPTVFRKTLPFIGALILGVLYCASLVHAQQCTGMKVRIAAYYAPPMGSFIGEWRYYENLEKQIDNGKADCIAFAATHGVDAALKRFLPSNGYYGHTYENLFSDGQTCSMDIHAHHPTYGYAGANFVAGPEVINGECVPGDPLESVGEQCTNTPNPLNIATGNKYRAEQDYRSQDGTLEFTRHYNSQATNAPVANPFASALGPNWRSTYERAVRVATSGAEGAYVYRPDGKTVLFKESAGVYAVDRGTDDRLERITTNGVFSGWRYTNGATSAIELYDASGQLTSIVDRSGAVTSLTYDTTGRLASVTNAFGRSLSFGYDSLNRLVTLTDPAAQTYSYSYGSTNNVEVVTGPDLTTRSYSYNEAAFTGGTVLPGAMTGIYDESGARYLTVRYNAALQATSSELANGVQKYQMQYADTPNRGSVIVTDPLGTSRTFALTTLQGTPRVISASARSDFLACARDKNNSYDVRGNATVRTNFNNRYTNYTYDTSRNLEITRQEGPGTMVPRNIQTQWHPVYPTPTQITEPGRRTNYTHDASGNVLTRTITDLTSSPNESRTWTYTYNSFGKLLTADGPRTDVNDVTIYTYYSCMSGYQCGQVETITNALGHVTTHNAYNAHGQPLTITDANGLVTTLTYDLRQRLTSRTIGTEQTTFEYWSTGLLKKVTLPDGSYVEYTYDAAHRLSEINDSEGNRIHYTLDAMGNRTKEEVFDLSNDLTGTRTQIFNALNLLYQQIGAAGGAAVTTTFGYDNDGNLTSVSAPLGRNTTQTYDELGRLKTITDAANGITSFGYNPLDQLTLVSDPRGKGASFAYNAFGDVKVDYIPDTAIYFSTTNTFDSAGNRKTRTDARSKTATYAYDALNRITSVTYADQVVGFTYDTGTNQKDRLTQISDNSGSTTWSYDAQGRVLSRQQTMGVVSKSVGYSYDASGHLQTLTLPSGNSVTYGYANGKVTGLTLNGSTTLLSNVLYHPFGPTTGWTWGNSTLAVRDYDQDGKITLVDSAGLKTYSHDDAFRITGITDATDPNLSQTYGYDLLDRLTSATGSSLNQNWTYDANGNRLTQGGNQASTYTVSTTSNRINSISGGLTRSYSYDNAGNTTSDGSATFTYNDAGRMISATKSGVTSTYALNGLGQRVRKTTSGASIYFVYDEAGHVIGEYDNSGTLITETIWLDEIPVAVLKSNGSGGVIVFYVHADHLNTPRRITRQSDNAIVWRWDSDPFGTAVANENPSGLGVFGYNLRFPGQYYDQETGLHYNYYRDYDPATGRYVQSDPIGLEGGINTYAYVAGNPISLTDPEGLDYWVEDADPSESGLGLHQSICVGKHGTKNRYCISFGRKPGQGDCWFECDGHTYVDRSPPGDIVYPMWRGTSRAVDRKIRQYLQSLLGEQRPWDVMGGENCRAFSQEVFNDLLNTHGGTPPPSLIDRLLGR